MFPVDDPLDEGDVRAAYTELWRDFEAESETLAGIEDSPTLLNALYHLMEKCTWSVPAAYYRSVPDISLFDHSRVTAAVAVCLTDFDDTAITHLIDAQQKHKPDDLLPVAYLLEGDLSGVQSFLYTITARGATPALRGRSFYLQLLTEAVARWILRELQLPLVNLIYASGGHFYILAPASTNVAQLQKAVDRLLLEYHEGDLYLALGAAKLTCADFQLNTFADAWRETSHQVNAAKRRRFTALTMDGLTELFAPKGHGGNEEDECQVCHHEGSDVALFAKYEHDQQPVRKCTLCASLEELGRDLRSAEHLLLAEMVPLETGQRDWRSLLARFGLAVAVGNNRNWSDTFPQQPQRALFLGLNEFPSMRETEQVRNGLNCPVARGQRFIANVAPHLPNGDFATFEHLQTAAQGIKRLGVLRMDVDNLGEIFSQGFRQLHAEGAANRATLARVASLSSALGRYFEGYVGHLCRALNDRTEQGRVYPIYSGGDDLFIVGSWDVLPVLAQQINDDFGRYTCGNPAFHVSGGLTLHGGKAPLYQAAQAAYQALDRAKDMDDKNAFCLFGCAVYWYDFVRVDQQRADLEAITQVTGNRSVLQLLLELYAQYEDLIEQQRTQGLSPRTRRGEAQIVWGPYMWRGLYQLTRLADRASKGRDLIARLRDTLHDQQFQNIQHVSLAARWAEARTRKNYTNREDNT